MTVDNVVIKISESGASGVISQLKAIGQAASLAHAQLASLTNIKLSASSAGFQNVFSGLQRQYEQGTNSLINTMKSKQTQITAATSQLQNSINKSLGVNASPSNWSQGRAESFFAKVENKLQNDTKNLERYTKESDNFLKQLAAQKSKIETATTDIQKLINKSTGVGKTDTGWSQQRAESLYKSVESQAQAQLKQTEMATKQAEAYLKQLNLQKSQVSSATTEIQNLINKNVGIGGGRSDFTQARAESLYKSVESQAQAQLKQAEIATKQAESVVKQLNAQKAQVNTVTTDIQKLINKNVGLNTSASSGWTQARAEAFAGKAFTTPPALPQAMPKLAAPASAAVGTWNGFFDGLIKKSQKLALNFRAMDAALLGVSGAIVARSYVEAADKAQNLKSAINSVVSSSELIDPVMNRLFDIAKATYQPIEAIEKIYLRTAVAAKAFGKTQEEVLKFTKGVAQSAAISFGTPREISNALLQFSQGLSSDRLGGEEFRAIAEQMQGAVTVLRKFAANKPLSMGELRQWSKDGKLTFETQFEAYKKAQKFLDEAMNKIFPTIGKQITNISTGWIEFLAKDFRASVLYNSVISGLQYINANFNTFIRIVVAAGIVAATTVILGLGGALLKAAVSASIFTQSFLAITTAVSLLVMFWDIIKVIKIEGIELGVMLDFAFQNPILAIKALWAYITTLEGSLQLIIGSVSALALVLVGSSMYSVAAAGFTLISGAITALSGSLVLLLPFASILGFMGAIAAGVALIIYENWEPIPANVNKTFADTGEAIRVQSMTWVDYVSNAVTAIGEKINDMRKSILSGMVALSMLGAETANTKAFQDFKSNPLLNKDQQDLKNVKGQQVTIGKPNVFPEFNSLTKFQLQSAAMQSKLEANRAEQQKKYDELQKRLNENQPKEGSIGTGKKTKKEHGRGHKTFEEYYHNIQEEGKFLNLGAFDREVGKKKLEVMKGLRVKELTKDQNDLLEAVLRSNEVAKQQGEIYDSIRGSLEQYNFALKALELDKSRYSVEEYNKKLRELRITYLETKTDFASGVQRGLDKLFLEEANQAQKIETALTNTMQEAKKANDDYAYGLKAIQILREQNKITTIEATEAENKLREAMLATKKDAQSGYELAKLKITQEENNKAAQATEAYTSLYKSVKGPQTTYTNNLAAINELLKDNVITSEQATQMRYKEAAAYYDTANTLEGGVKAAFASIADDSLKTGQQIKNVITNAFSKAEDAIVSFVRTGKVDFKSLVDSISEDLARLAINMAKAELFGGGQQGQGGGGLIGGLISGLSGLITGGGGGFTSMGIGDFTTGATEATSIAQGLPANFAFAKGGIFAYASGDVFSSPTAFSFGKGNLGVMGEAGPEAVMPLHRGPDGSLGVRAIGGAASGGGTTQVINNVTINMNGQRNDSDGMTAQVISKAVNQQIEMAMAKYVQRNRKTNGSLAG